MNNAHQVNRIVGSSCVISDEILYEVYESLHPMEYLHGLVVVCFVVLISTN